MCGIAGWLSNRPCGNRVAKAVAQTLFHRGPNGDGSRSWPEVTLIHTRLSVIDLSPAGAQPMANEDGTVWTVFNGEIYNHRELRHELEARGHSFKSHSDTEILPHLYEESGLDCVTKLRGMFAFAIYDTRAHTLMLARDRYGIKPLFYAPGVRQLAFASEIPALLKFPGIDARPDKQAIYDFAALFYIPAPETFYAGIKALQPGEIVEARLDHDEVVLRTHKYHQWAITPDPTITLSQASERAGALLDNAVRSQMESDVPLGALLSGGIDSSLVSSAAQSALTRRLRTFNVRFPDREYDETWAATAVANYIGSQHDTLDLLSGHGSWNHITDLLKHAGQPFADSSLFAVNAVARLMRKHVTVALSGDGGDEGFGGYDMYWRMGTIVFWQRLPLPIWQGATALLGCLAPLGLVSEPLPLRMKDLSCKDDASVLQSLFCWIREEEHSRLCVDKHLLPVRRYFEKTWEYHLPDRASRRERISAHATEINTRMKLPNDYLFKVDSASMKESLEIRIPMLDEDLFAFGLSLPHSLKVKGHTCKRVLREVAKARLPSAVANKHKKGFDVPLDTWMDSESRAHVREVLLGPSNKLANYFRLEVYRPIIEAFCDGRPYAGISRRGLYQRVIMLLSLQLALCHR